MCRRVLVPLSVSVHVSCIPDLSNDAGGVGRFLLGTPPLGTRCRSSTGETGHYLLTLRGRRTYCLTTGNDPDRVFSTTDASTGVGCTVITQKKP